MPRQPYGDEDVPHGMGSPLVAHPGNRMPQGTTTMAGEQTAFQMAMKQCHTDYMSSRSRSRKRENTQLVRAATPTPTQLPAQKNFKLKATVTVVEPASQPRHRSSSRNRRQVNETPAWRPHHGAPYHLIGVCKIEGEEDQESEKTLLLYMMNRFTW